MSYVMEANEIITLSSDDENDFESLFEPKLKFSAAIEPILEDSDSILKSYLQKFKQFAVNKSRGLIIKSNNDEIKIVKLPKVPKEICVKNSKESPEIVDLEESIEKSRNKDKAQYSFTNQDSFKSEQSYSKLDIIDIDDISNSPPSHEKIKIDDNVRKEATRKTEQNKNKITPITINKILYSDKNINDIEEIQSTSNEQKPDKGFNQNLKFFTEFVEYCGSLENIPNDRARLTKKLMKRYGEADCNYIKSQEFRNLIQKCRDKVTANNLYLTAKEITDELTYRKKIEITTGKSIQLEKTEEKSQRNALSAGKKGRAQLKNSKQSKKKTKIINQIITKLDKLGTKIRELETQEVDLSDEEESSYVQLQRYRERFCQIYSKLCKYTNEVANADHIYNPKICFTESKYPAINKCIENWLNKTKRFPDFADILKLLETQSSSIGLPSNRESIRTIAIEIFQKVGAMLQRRRIYDLWDSFCELLDTAEDPANSDPVLDWVLKRNFEARIKKEQEIFQHFVELQEKERLEPEEVPDEEANRSPIESGSEDEKELEYIENSLNKKLDDAIKKDTEENDKTFGKKDRDGGGCNSGNETVPIILENMITSKESKNNFKNCKSLKWRLENGGKSVLFSGNSEDSNTGTENKKKKKIDGGNSDLELIAVENFNSNSKGICLKIKKEKLESPLKRTIDEENEDPIQKKKKCSKNEGRSSVFDFDDDNENLNEKLNEVFNVHCCQIFADNVFEDLYEKKRDWEKRKVFRDLTNVNRLMELHGKRKKMSGLYSPSFFHRSFYEFEKSSWKNRFRVSYKLVGPKGQKLAISQEEKSRKTVNSNSGRDTVEKDIHNSSETGKEHNGDNFFSGEGNGNEEDNNEDKNKKNGRSDEGRNEIQLEEEEDDEEDNETDKDENKLIDEGEEHSFLNQKTEKLSDANLEGKTAFKNGNDTNFIGETVQSCNEESEKSASESINKNEDILSDEKVLLAKEILGNTHKKCEISGEKADFKGSKENYEPKSNKSSKNEKGDIETQKDPVESKNSPGETVENCNGEHEYEMKALNNTTEDEGKYVEIDESKPEILETEKQSCEIVGSEHEAHPSRQELLKPESKNQSATPNKLKENVGRRTAEKAKNQRNPAVILTKNENKKAKTLKQETVKNKSGISRKPVEVDLTGYKFQKKNTPSTSDEERVKRFLLHSPSSISITPPRKHSFLKPPSQAALEALATLRNLKGISATIVRSKPKNEDDVVVIGGSHKRRHADQNSTPAKRRRSDLPIISNVQSVCPTTPKITTVQGNASGFEYSGPDVVRYGDSDCGSSSIRISSVWGNLPDNFQEPAQNDESAVPGCSSYLNSPGSSYSFRKKNTKKTVEYVVLE